MGRVVPDPLAGPHAAAHLVLAAVPGRLGHRAREPHVDLLRGGLPPLASRSGASSPPSPSPPSSSASSLGIPLGRPPHDRAIPASGFGCCRSSRSGIAARVDRVRAGARPRRRGGRATSLVSGLAALLAPGIFAVAVARDPAEGPLARLLDGVAVRAARPASCCPSSAARRPVRHPRRPARHGADVPHRRGDPVVGLARS